MKKINKTYRFRLYPNDSQKELLAKHFGCTRYVYNYFLERRKRKYIEKGKSENYYSQAKELTELKKKKDMFWLKEVNSQSLQFSLRNLDTAYSNFFHKRTKFPKFHSKKNKESFTVPQNAILKDNKLYLPKFKDGIPVKVHRPIKGEIGKVCITKTPTGKYFVSIFTEEEYEEVEHTSKSVGIDLGIKNLIVTSDGRKFKNNKYIKKYEKKLTKSQKHLSRKKKGSQGYENQRLKVAKIHEKISNFRKDYLHKCSSALIKDYDIICVEDLNVKNMKGNRRLSKSISDTSWSTLLEFLTYKAEWNNKYVVKIGRFFPSSQMCSYCGYINNEVKKLNVREWDCPRCGNHHDRDVNASINILGEGLRNISAGTVDYTNGEEVRVYHLVDHSS